MKQFGIGQPVRRVEDRRFITGHGCYLDDIVRPRQAHAFMLRSPHAHARIARSTPRRRPPRPASLAVFTGDDLARDGIGASPASAPSPTATARRSVLPPHPAIGRDRVRHVGDTVAMVVAETAAAARDAAELVAVEYEPLPAVVEPAGRSIRASRRCGTRRPAICASTGKSATGRRSSARPPGRATASRSSSSTTASSSIRWSRAARSANTIRARRLHPVELDPGLAFRAQPARRQRVQDAGEPHPRRHAATSAAGSA